MSCCATFWLRARCYWKTLIGYRPSIESSELFETLLFVARASAQWLFVGWVSLRLRKGRVSETSPVKFDRVFTAPVPIIVATTFAL